MKWSRRSLSACVALSLGVSVLAACAASSPRSFRPQSTDLVGETTVPLKIVRHMPLVKASVNGHTPGYFIIDTGSAGSMVSARLAEALELPKVMDVSGWKDASGKPRRRVSVVRIDALQVGEAVFSYFIAGAGDLSILETSLGVPIDGVLGCAHFHDCLLEIDYPGETVRLRSGSLSKADSDSVLGYITNLASPFIMVDVLGLPRRVKLNTGSDLPLGFPYASEAELIFKTKPVYGSRAKTLSGSAFRLHLGRLDGEVSLGPWRISDPIVYLSPLEASVGGEILRYFTITIDQKEKLVRLVKQAEGEFEFTPIRSSGVSIGIADGSWVVHDVLPDSKAVELGVKEGDRVVAVNGKPTRELSLKMWSIIEKTKSSVTIRVKQDQKEFDATLPITTRVH